jgi:type VI secretion system secreted protein VgrG
MPSPKSGSAGSPVGPAGPKKADEADKADPGEVEKIKAEQRKAQTGKYGSVKAKPFKPAAAKDEEEKEKKKKVWIEIEMVDEQDQPVAGMRYRITLPDDTVTEGTTDEKGVGRVEGIDPGTCKITFPTLDKDAWEQA